MNGTQRIKALIEGTPLDRTPVAGWYHMPLVDRNVCDFVRETIASTDVNRWDFIKVMTNGHFYTQAYGGDITFSVNEREWYGTINRYPVTCAADARAMEVLGLDNPVWQRELEIYRRLKDHYGETLPIVATIFNPITAVQECMGCLDSRPIKALMEEDPEALHHALDVMTQTNQVYLDGLISEGLDGIFLANQYSMARILTQEQYDEFVVPYERRILEHVAGRTWFNMAHVHGTEDLRFDTYLSYPDDVLHALNWENCPADADQAKVSTMGDVRARTNKVLIAGIDQRGDFETPQNDREQVKERLKRRYLDAKGQIGSNRFVFGPGCVLQTGGSYLNALIAEVADELGQSE